MSVLQLKDSGKNGTLKHRLVSYVINHDKGLFECYVLQVIKELENRNISYKIDLLTEIIRWCYDKDTTWGNYPEHNQRYFVQCYNNLEEKHDRGIISDEEWYKINDAWFTYYEE